MVPSRKAPTLDAEILDIFLSRVELRRKDKRRFVETTDRKV
jgi:hypothetical protein